MQSLETDENQTMKQDEKNCDIAKAFWKYEYENILHQGIFVPSSKYFFFYSYYTASTVHT